MTVLQKLREKIEERMAQHVKHRLDHGADSILYHRMEARRDEGAAILFELNQLEEAKAPE
jgi:hypothetical protein